MTMVLTETTANPLTIAVICHIIRLSQTKAFDTTTKPKNVAKLKRMTNKHHAAKGGMMNAWSDYIIRSIVGH